jgi:hypothetical protein
VTRHGRHPVICGLGLTELGKVYGPTAAQFAADAVRFAAADADLALGDIDGLLVSYGVANGVHLDLQLDLRLHDLAPLFQMQAYGSTAGAMVQVASMAVQSGMATRSPACGPTRRSGQAGPAPRPTGPRREVSRDGGDLPPPPRSPAPTRCTPWRRVGSWNGTAPAVSNWAPSRSPSATGRC